MAFALLTERGRGRVEVAVDALQRLLIHAKSGKLLAQGVCVRRFHRPITSVAATVVGRAQCAATGMSDRSEARRAMRYHHADVVLEFAFDANAMRRGAGPASFEESRNYFKQLALVDRAATQLEINRNMVCNRCRGRESTNIFGSSIDD